VDTAAAYELSRRAAGKLDAICIESDWLKYRIDSHSACPWRHTLRATRQGVVVMQKFTEADIAYLRGAFESCDPNGDGFIDREEFHALLNKLDGDVSQAEALLDFEVADTEGDGYIGFKEFIVWWTS
jgi:hypothetical protein